MVLSSLATALTKSLESPSSHVSIWIGNLISECRLYIGFLGIVNRTVGLLFRFVLGWRLLHGFCIWLIRLLLLINLLPSHFRRVISCWGFWSWVLGTPERFKSFLLLRIWAMILAMVWQRVWGVVWWTTLSRIMVFLGLMVSLSLSLRGWWEICLRTKSSYSFISWRLSQIVLSIQDWGSRLCSWVWYISNVSSCLWIVLSVLFQLVISIFAFSVSRVTSFWYGWWRPSLIVYGSVLSWIWCWFSSQASGSVVGILLIG